MIRIGQRATDGCQILVVKVALVEGGHSLSKEGLTNIIKVKESDLSSQTNSKVSREVREFPPWVSISSILGTQLKPAVLYPSLLVPPELHRTSTHFNIPSNHIQIDPLQPYLTPSLQASDQILWIHVQVDQFITVRWEAMKGLCSIGMRMVVLGSNVEGVRRGI